MQISLQQASVLLVLVTLIFLLAPIFLAYYVKVYNHKKRDHFNEKKKMEESFEYELQKVKMEVRERTLQTIGADLHDNIGQLLGLTSLTLSSINLDEPDRAQKKIDDSIALTNRSIKELRQLAHLLNGGQLLHSSLIETIRTEIDWLYKTERFNIQLNVLPYQGACNADKDIVIFRLLQEMLNNIIKHAEATEIAINLQIDNNALNLKVNDNGKGYDPAHKPLGLGITSMKKRADLIGGSLLFDSQVGMGVQVKFQVAYP